MKFRNRVRRQIIERQQLLAAFEGFRKYSLLLVILITTMIGWSSEEPQNFTKDNANESRDRPNSSDSNEPAKVQFDDEEEFNDENDKEDPHEEDDEEFYMVNPIDQLSGEGEDDDDDIEADIKINKTEFNDFDDHKAMNSNDFYTNGGDKNRRKKKRVRRLKLNRKLKNFTDTDRKHQVGESYVSDRLSGCAMVQQQRGGCLTFAMIEWAARSARRLLGHSEAPDDLGSMEPSESTINAAGELIEMTTRLLAQRYQLDHDEVNFALEQVDLRPTSLWRTCPALFRQPPICPVLSRFRTHTGQCNNLLAPHLGSSFMPFVRMLPPDYGDGVGYPRRSSSGLQELPPVRLLALQLHPDVDQTSSDQSALFMAWGQLINHDLALASGARESTGHSQNCCPIRRPTLRNRICMPIQIGPDDPLYAPYRIRCHDFKRSIAGLRPGCSLGPRTQVNLITSYVDASFVYGSTRSMTSSLRRNARGLLSTWNYFARQNLKPLLPPQLDEPDQECVGRRGGMYCFRSGDMRTNQQIQLVALHTIHTRQHNRLASALGQLNPHWDDNRIYHEARHIHVALVQHILLSEYLPMLLGERLCAKYNLKEAPPGSYWDHYDPSVNPGVSQEFAAAAFRQGHTLVPNLVYRFSTMHEPRRVYLLRSLFRQPWALYEPGAMDEFLLGMTNAPSQSFDPFISSDLSGHLLQTPQQSVGLDLTAINLQRGRDQGVASYNSFRDWCGLKRANSFADLESYMSSQSVEVMASLYGSVDDIDLFSGGISEFPVKDAQVGPTFACIIGRQFEAIRAGDRLWFESSNGPHAFTLDQLESIKSVSLARIICANSDNIFTIQQMALRLPHPVLNPYELCNSLPDLDISLWFEPRISIINNDNNGDGDGNDNDADDDR